MKKLSVMLPISIIPWLIITISILIDICQVNPYMLIVCTAIIYALFLFIYSLTNRIWVSWLGVSIPVFLLVLINYYKLKINGSPFLPSDFSFVSGIDKILQFSLPQIEFTVFMFLYIVLYIAFTVFLIFLEKHLIKNKRIRILSLAVGLIISLIMFIPQSHNLISKFGYENTTFSEELILKHGVIAGMYSAVGSIPANSDSSLDREKISEIVNSQKRTEQNVKKPTVIFLMSESFFDIDRLDNVDFSEDPIKNFHELKKQFSCGDFISSTYCGGTGNVEFEFLTGMCRYFLNPDDSFDNMSDETYIRIPSISDIFKNNGYSVKFLHSYDNSLFNRVNIYRNFKFDEVVFAEDFKTNVKYSGGYISDETLANEIISIYESTTDEPLMLYAISMENHQPYTEDKYDETSGIKISSDMISEADKKIFETFIHGLSNADKALGQLVEYFSNVNEPVMIVFWGDHLPNLNLQDGSNIYQKLKYAPNGNNYEWKGKGLLKMLTTDYVIWDNFGLKKTDTTLSSAMLGVEMVDRLGFEMPNYFKWLSESIKDDYIVYRSRVFASRNEVSDTVPKKYQSMINDYSMVVRDIVYGESDLFGIPQR